MTTKEILQIGHELNKKHQEYLDAPDHLKRKVWNEFYIEAIRYSNLVDKYIKSNPSDLNKTL